MEQKRCLLAALKSEKEMVVENIDEEEDKLQRNDTEAAQLRRSAENMAYSFLSSIGCGISLIMCMLLPKYSGLCHNKVMH